MSARSRLDEFDKAWPAFQSAMREGRLRVQVVISSIGMGESETDLPPTMMLPIEEALYLAATRARAQLVVDAIAEARKTLEELE